MFSKWNISCERWWWAITGIKPPISPWGFLPAKPPTIFTLQPDYFISQHFSGSDSSKSHGMPKWWWHRKNKAPSSTINIFNKIITWENLKIAKSLKVIPIYRLTYQMMKDICFDRKTKTKAKRKTIGSHLTLSRFLLWEMIPWVLSH